MHRSILLCSIPLCLAACQSILGIEDTTERSATGGAGGSAPTGGSSGGGGTSGSGGAVSGGGSGGAGGVAGGGGTSPDSSVGGSGGDSGPDACPTSPDFSVSALADASVNRGKSVQVPVTVSLQACFSAAIDVTLGSSPGLSAPPAQIPAGQTQTVITISAAAGATVGPVTVSLSLNGGGQSHTAPLKLLVRDEAGELDESFTTFASGTGTVRALATESDGDIIVAVNPTAPTTGWSIRRLKADGALDSTFNPTSLPSSGGIRDVAVGGNGQIVAVGDDSTGVVVVRLTTGGAGDPVMGANGVYDVPSANFPSTAFAKALVLQPDNKPVFVGNVQNSEGIVARVNPAQSSTPVPPGKVDLQATFSGAPMSAVALGAGRLIAGGVKGGHVHLTAVSDSSGALDTSFGTNGSTTYSPAAFEGVRDGLITASAIFLCGEIQGGADVIPTLFRFGLDGKNPSHTAVAHPDAYNIRYVSCAAQADGKVVAIGSGGTTASGYRVFVTRFNTDGSVDTSFAPNASPKGTKVFQVGGNTTAGAIAVAPDGRIIAGVQSPSGPTVVRLWN